MVQVAIETIYVLIQTFVYSMILYSMIGYEWTGEKFFYFYYFIFMCFTYFSMYGMMVVALTPGHQIAAIVMSFFLSFWNLFSGFMIPRPVSDLEPTCFFFFLPLSFSHSTHRIFFFGSSNHNSEYAIFTANPRVVEVVLLGFACFLDNLRPFRVPNRRHQE